MPNSPVDPAPAHCPRYLADYSPLFEENPHQANLAWFADASYGLFIGWVGTRLGKRYD